jgi:hypothetical protein
MLLQQLLQAPQPFWVVVKLLALCDGGEEQHADQQLQQHGQA